MATVAPRRTSIPVPSRSTRRRHISNRPTEAPRQVNHGLNTAACICSCNCNCVNCLCSARNEIDEPWNPHRAFAGATSRVSPSLQGPVISFGSPQSISSAIEASLPGLTAGEVSESEDEFEENMDPEERGVRLSSHHLEDDYEHVAHYDDYNVRDDQHWVQESPHNLVSPHHTTAMDGGGLSTTPEDENPHLYFLEQPTTSNSHDDLGSPPAQADKLSESDPMILGDMDLDSDAEQDVSCASLNPLVGSHINTNLPIRSPAGSVSSLISSLLFSLSGSKTNSPMNTSAALNGVGMGFGEIPAPGPSYFPVMDSRRPSWSPSHSSEEGVGRKGQWLALL